MEVDQIERIPVERIVIGDDRRPLRDVTSLMASIEEVGILNPLTVSEDYRLIAGLHRLEAAKRLGMGDVPCYVVGLSGLRAKLAELDENLQRTNHDALELGEMLAERKRIYLALHPETRNGAMGGGKEGRGSRTKTENDNLSFSVPTFSQDTARAMGVHRRTIERSVQIGEGLTDDTKQVVRGTDLAKQRQQLIDLAAIPNPTEQRAVAEQVVTHGIPVKEAAKNVGATVTARKAAPKKKHHERLAHDDKPIVGSVAAEWATVRLILRDRLLVLKPDAVTACLVGDEAAKARELATRCRNWLTAFEDSLNGSCNQRSTLP